MQRVLLVYIMLITSMTQLFGGKGIHELPVIYAKKPEVPPEAWQRHWSGIGLFALHIRRDGIVERVDTIKSIGHRALDSAAVAAFRMWRFYPKNSLWILRVPIRYVYGPPRTDDAIARPARPGYAKLISIFYE